MRRRRGAMIFLAALSMVLIGPWRPSVGAAPPQANDEPASPAEVERTYLADCAICHGSDGRGTNRGPTLVGVGRASLDYYLTTGRMPLPPLADIGTAPERRPPAYRGALIDALVEYTHDLTGGGGPDIPRLLTRAANVARGGELYRLQCAACHAWAGDGGALLDRTAPSLHPATSRQTAEAIRAGPGLMPAFGRAALNDRDLAAVVAYVDYLDDPEDRGGQPLWHLGPMPEGAVALVVGLGTLFVITRWIGDREPREKGPREKGPREKGPREKG
jgi:ubiquinol-cytochrome c reductase cytochrome c subunit